MDGVVGVVVPDVRELDVALVGRALASEREGDKKYGAEGHGVQGWEEFVTGIWNNPWQYLYVPTWLRDR